MAYDLVGLARELGSNPNFDASYPLTRTVVIPGLDFIFDICRDPYADNIEKLFVPFQAFSDVHLGTPHARAKLLARMCENTVAGRLILNGDIIDLTYLRKQNDWEFGPWHRQVLAHFLRKAARGTKLDWVLGNHEKPIRDLWTEYGGHQTGWHNMCGRNWLVRDETGCIAGEIRFARETYHVVTPGFILKAEHGDGHDGSGGHYPEEVTRVLGIMSDIDTGVQNVPGLNDFSAAQALKERIKNMKKWKDINRGIAAVLDNDHGISALLTGHDHMGGYIHRTPLNKLMLNDDSCTEYVKAIMHDRNGTFALFEWHKHYLLVTEEGKEPVWVSFNQLGLPHCHDKPKLHEDVYTYQADRTVRPIRRIAAPKKLRKKKKHRKKERARCEAKGRKYKGATAAFIDLPKVARPQGLPAFTDVRYAHSTLRAS